jgi:hypothetical protein
VGLVAAPLEVQKPMQAAKLSSTLHVGRTVRDALIRVWSPLLRAL